MRACVCRPSRWCAVAVAVLLTACGETSSDSSSSTAAPSTAATTTAEVLPTVDQVDAMLLTVDDVFDGWKLGSPINEADLDDSVQVPCANTAINPTIAQRLKAVTGVQFEPVDGSYNHLIEFATVGDPARLAADLDALFGALDSCGPEFTGGGGEGSGTLKELALPELGDQRKGYVITGKDAPETDVVWYVRTAYVRVGTVAITVSLAEVLPVENQTPTISDEEFVRVVQTAVGKMSA